MQLKAVSAESMARLFGLHSSLALGLWLVQSQAKIQGISKLAAVAAGCGYDLLVLPRWTSQLEIRVVHKQDEVLLAIEKALPCKSSSKLSKTNHKCLSCLSNLALQFIIQGQRPLSPEDLDYITSAHLSLFWCQCLLDGSGCLMDIKAVPSAPGFCNQFQSQYKICDLFGSFPISFEYSFLQNNYIQTQF